MSNKSGILTQTITITDPNNPLETKTVNVPVRKGEKIYCTEPYVIDVLKHYSTACEGLDFSQIAEVEKNSYKSIVSAQVSKDYKEGDKTANIIISPKHTVSIDLGTKTGSHITASQEIVAGGVIDIVLNKNKGKMWADATSSAFEKEKLRNELIRQIGQPTNAYSALVKECVYNASQVFNGYTVTINSVDCFMPGSEASVAPLDDYTSIVGKEIYVVPINLVKESIVVSHKLFLSTLQVAVLDELENLPKKTLVQGVVSSVKEFGAFVMIKDCVSTLLLEPEMDEVTHAKFQSKSLKVGDEIEFFIETIADGRVTITQTSSKVDGWNTLDTRVSDAVKGGKQFAEIETKVIKRLSNGYIVEVKDLKDITFFVNGRFLKTEQEYAVGADMLLKLVQVDTSKRNVRLFY